MRPDTSCTTLAVTRFNLALIEDFIGGFSFEIFEREWKTRYATLHALEIVLDASRRLPADLINRHPAIGWSAMQDAAANERQHQDCGSASQLWKTASEDLPPLLTIIKAELAIAEHVTSRVGP